MKTTKCAHRWKIDGPAGKYSWGVCSRCKARRLYRNSWPNIANWGNERKKRLLEERRLKRKEKRDADKQKD